MPATCSPPNRQPASAPPRSRSARRRTRRVTTRRSSRSARRRRTCCRCKAPGLVVLRVAALDALRRVRDLVALGGGVVLHVRHAGPVAVLALEAAQRGAAGARRAARL